MSSDIDVIKFEALPFIKRSATTAVGNVPGTTLVDATLTEPNDFWNGSWLLIRTGTYAREMRQVTDFDNPTRTLTLDHTVGGQIVNGIQYVMSLRQKVELLSDSITVGAAHPLPVTDPAVSPAEGTFTAAGLPGGTTAIDTTRTEPNNHWTGMVLLITSGARLGQCREITNWVLGTGTFTVAPAFGGQILAGVTYKVLAELPGIAEIAAIEAKLDARLDVAVSTRAPEAGGNIAAILADTADMQPRVPRILCSIDFWGDIIEELQLTSALQANLALAGADVVIAGLPAGITLVRVVVMFMSRAIENTHATIANKLQGAQNIEVNFAGGAFLDAIALADDLFGVAAVTREMGTVLVGKIDVKATVTGNGTCTFRIDAARADQNNLNFNDYQVGVRVFFTV